VGGLLVRGREAAPPCVDPTSVGIKYRRFRDKQPRQRLMPSLTGIGFRSQFSAFNNSLCNLVKGVVERVFVVKGSGGEYSAPPAPTFAALEQVAATFQKFSLRCVVTTPISWQQFVNSYEGRKRTMYQKALEGLITRGRGKFFGGVDTFIKCEKIDFGKKPDAVPRVIQPRDQQFNIEFGSYLKPIENGIYHKLDLMLGKIPSIMKGYTVQQVGGFVHRKWARFVHPVAIDLDASRFDQHVSYNMLKLEHSVYLAHYDGHHKELLKQLCNYQLVNRCRGRARDGVVKYEVSGCRMSGDMNTALGNIVIMVLVLKTYFDIVGVDCELVNNGDDSVIICERSAYDKFRGLPKFMLSCGFNMKIGNPVDVLEHVEFCQTRPVYTSTGWVMCRDPRVVVRKDSICRLPMTTNEMIRAWSRDVGKCGLSNYGDMPVLSAYYSTMVRVGNVKRVVKHHAMETFRYFGATRQSGTKVSEETRYSFYKAFGIMPDVQIAFEQQCSTVSVPDDVSAQDAETSWFEAMF